MDNLFARLTRNLERCKLTKIFRKADFGTNGEKPFPEAKRKGTCHRIPTFRLQSRRASKAINPGALEVLPPHPPFSYNLVAVVLNEYLWNLLPSPLTPTTPACPTQRWPVPVTSINNSKNLFRLVFS